MGKRAFKSGRGSTAENAGRQRAVAGDEILTFVDSISRLALEKDDSRVCNQIVRGKYQNIINTSFSNAGSEWTATFAQRILVFYR